MNGRLSKKEKNILDNLDRMLAGQELLPACGFLEDKLFQALKALEYSEEKRAREHESVTGLMNDISHQLKTPLSALSVHLELASDTLLEETERQTALFECREQVEKIRFLSDAMFKVARLESGLIEIKKIGNDICETIKEAVETLKPKAELKGLSVKADFTEKINVPHDPLWTKEALINLLDNAIKYTGRGKIVITVEKGVIYTRIDIADTGIAVPPDEYAKIFKRFYRLRPKGTERIEGTGLGLPIAREILRRQGGNITVSSPYENDTGSVFSVFLQNC